MSAVLFFFLTLLGTNSPQPPAGDTNSTFEQTAKQAETARTSNRLNDAIPFYSQGVRMRPSWSEGWWWLGSLLYDQDRFAEASTAFQRFIAIAPKPAPGYAFLALSEYETHKYDAALRHFEDWKRRGSPGTDELLDVGGFHWALLLTQRGQFTEALYLLAAKARKRG